MKKKKKSRKSHVSRDVSKHALLVLALFTLLVSVVATWLLLENEPYQISLEQTRGPEGSIGLSVIDAPQAELGSSAGGIGLNFKGVK